MIDAATCGNGVRTSAARIGEMLRLAPAAPLSRYPGHDVRDVAAHQWEIHRWVDRLLTERAATRPQRDIAPIEWTIEELGAQLEATADALAGRLEQIDPDLPVWTFGEPPTARFWQTRMLHETVMHRWDAEDAALGETSPIPADIGLSALREGVVIHLARPLAQIEVGGAGERILLTCSDHDVAWVVTLLDEGINVDTAAPGAAAAARVRGSAAGLWLYASGRTPTPDVEVDGDPAVIDRFVAARARIPAALR